LISPGDKRTAAEYKPLVDTRRLQALLGDLPRFATRAGGDDFRQIWRFELDGQAYFLHFYPRDAMRFRWLLGNPAHREFFGLQTLQKASIPSPRAIAQLSGLWLDGRAGDAVIVQGVEPTQRMDTFLLEHDLRAEPIPNRRLLALHLRTILQQLGRAGLGHRALALRHFLVGGERVYLRNGAGVRRGGLRRDDVMALQHEAARFATRSELRRTWDLLMPGTAMPARNPLAARLRRRFLRTIFRDGPAFGTIRCQGWAGVFTKATTCARRWSIASQISPTRDQWLVIWPKLLAEIEQGTLTVLKQDSSGDVLSTQIELCGRPIGIILKRPKRKHLHRYILDLVRPARARRMWKKAWQLNIRNLPTEWPMLLMEKRVLGYVTDSLIVFERVPGKTLDQTDLDALSPPDRQTLFRRLGRILRTLEHSGLAHYDAKSTNWIIVEDDHLGPTPIMIDLDGIRPLTWKRLGCGIRRLLRSMRQHPQYTPSDSLELCRGFAPFSRIERDTQELVTGEHA
jgi:tRNA A-37 threonylcarbamoyl transferase component Bud32